MPRIDVTDEAIIDSSPMEVYKAVLNEFAGVTYWWMPYNGFKLRGIIPDKEIGKWTNFYYSLQARFP